VGVAQKYELYRYIRFNSAVQSAEWNDADKKWHTKVEVQASKEAEFGQTYTITSDFLVSAVGQLNVPQMPDIPGLSDFKGKLMHSARWDWSYDIQGKSVAIIGNGATAAQIIPEIAKTVGDLTIYQRTPNWIVPRGDEPIPTWKRSLYRWLPYVRHRKRADMMDFREWTYGFVEGGQSETSNVFRDMSIDMMKTQLADRPDLWTKLQPEYDVGCKRIIISDDYFPVFNRENVTLETKKIDNINAHGIVAEGEEKSYDLIILATGFRSVEFMSPIDIRGSGGRSISEIWQEGGEALYGVAVESLPNFGMLYGPNTNLGHNSIILMIEAQSRYINALAGKVLEARLNGGQLVIQPNSDIVAKFNQKIQEELKTTSFADPRCGSWYKRTDNGKITQNWSSTVISYQKARLEVTSIVQIR
jgi:cation diffusion facilitator CzcD-associated flavoprotein CzcO